MRNFFAKLTSYKQQPETPPEDSTSPRIKPGRRWQTLNSMFDKQFILPLLLTAAFFMLPTYVQAQVPTTNPAEEPPDEAEVFFRREKEAHVPIIMYHLVTDNKRHIGKWGITPADLRADLEYLKANGYNTVVMQDLINFVEKGKKLPENPIVLTFDDGNTSDYTYLYPLLQEFDMKAVICIMGAATDNFTAEQAKNPKAKHPHMTWDQVKELHKSGHFEVQSHGYDVHGRNGAGKQLRESAEAYHQRLLADLKKMQDLCEEHLGVRPSTFCYPLGVISKGSQEVLEEIGFVASLSCQEGMNTLKRGEMECLVKLNRVNRANGRSIGGILEKLKK